MKAPLFVRPLADAERRALEAGLRSSDTFVLRRSQILLASARGERAGRIARLVGCSAETVRTVIKTFNRCGVAALRQRSRRPRTTRPAFDAVALERLRDLLHRSPRDFDRPTSLWTLDLAAEVSFAEGLPPARVSGETVRAALARLGLRWRRAKQWITSPDPAYARKKVSATG